MMVQNFLFFSFLYLFSSDSQEQTGKRKTNGIRTDKMIDHTPFLPMYSAI